MAEAYERQTKEDDGALCGMSWSAACRKTPVVESLDVRKKWRAVCLQRGQHGSEGDARMRPRGVTASTLHFFITLGRRQPEQVSTACDEEEGLFQKPTLAGKPRDMLTETRLSGR